MKNIMTIILAGLLCLSFQSVQADPTPNTHGGV